MFRKTRVGSNKMYAASDSVLTHARLCIATAAGDRGWDDTRQSWLARAARRLGLPYCRIFGIWYGRARLYADEYEQLKERAQQLSQRITQAEDDLHASRNRLQDLAGGAIDCPSASPSPVRRPRHRAAAAAAVRPKEVK